MTRTSAKSEGPTHGCHLPRSDAFGISTCVLDGGLETRMLVLIVPLQVILPHVCPGASISLACEPWGLMDRVDVYIQIARAHKA